MSVYPLYLTESNNCKTITLCVIVLQYYYLSRFSNFNWAWQKITDKTRDVTACVFFLTNPFTAFKFVHCWCWSCSWALATCASRLCCQCFGRTCCISLQVRDGGSMLITSTTTPSHFHTVPIPKDRVKINIFKSLKPVVLL